MKENWGPEGMPPYLVDVLATEVLCESDGYKLYKHYVRGHYPHLGSYTPGWTGPETVVFREHIQTEDGERIRYKKDYGKQ